MSSNSTSTPGSVKITENDENSGSGVYYVSKVPNPHLLADPKTFDLALRELKIYPYIINAKISGLGIIRIVVRFSSPENFTGFKQKKNVLLKGAAVSLRKVCYKIFVKNIPHRSVEALSSDLKENGFEFFKATIRSTRKGLVNNALIRLTRKDQYDAILRQKSLKLFFARFAAEKFKPRSARPGVVQIRANPCQTRSRPVRAEPKPPRRAPKSSQLPSLPTVVLALEKSLRAAQQAINLLAMLSNDRSLAAHGAGERMREKAGKVEEFPAESSMEGTSSRENIKKMEGGQMPSKGDAPATQVGLKTTLKKEESCEMIMAADSEKKSKRKNADTVEESNAERKTEKTTEPKRRHAGMVEESIAERKTEKTTEPMRRHAGRVEESDAERKTEKATESMRRHADRVEENCKERLTEEADEFLRSLTAEEWIEFCRKNGVSGRHRLYGLRRMNEMLEEEEKDERSRHMAMPRRPELE